MFGEIPEVGEFCDARARQIRHLDQKPARAPLTRTVFIKSQRPQCRQAGEGFSRLAVSTSARPSDANSRFLFCSDLRCRSDLDDDGGLWCTNDGQKNIFGTGFGGVSSGRGDIPKVMLAPKPGCIGGRMQRDFHHGLLAHPRQRRTTSNTTGHAGSAH